LALVSRNAHREKGYSLELFLDDDEEAGAGAG
jgi:hypothetical protein